MEQGDPGGKHQVGLTIGRMSEMDHEQPPDKMAVAAGSLQKAADAAPAWRLGWAISGLQCLLEPVMPIARAIPLSHSPFQVDSLCGGCSGAIRLVRHA